MGLGLMELWAHALNWTKARPRGGVWLPLLLFPFLPALGPVQSAESQLKAHSAGTAAAQNVSASKSSETVRAAEPSTLEVARAVMVTVELDFGTTPPGVAEALTQVQRRSQPDDGVGRTFAILDAYGEPTPEGKLHMSMHVSSEKPGLGSLVFKRTGEVLWQSRIVRGTNAPGSSFTRKGLVILLDNGAGRTITVDGSNNPRSILEAKAKEMGVSVSEIWPEGSEREVTFLYSACGCPVKVMVMRTGDKTARTRNLPVIFPDDPAVVTVINRIMRWD
jgi:hypothetical protein